jgi:hypothetical protein
MISIVFILSFILWCIFNYLNFKTLSKSGLRDKYGNIICFLSLQFKGKTLPSENKVFWNYLKNILISLIVLAAFLIISLTLMA